MCANFTLLCAKWPILREDETFTKKCYEYNNNQNILHRIPKHNENKFLYQIN